MTVSTQFKVSVGSVGVKIVLHLFFCLETSLKGGGLQNGKNMGNYAHWGF